MIKLVMLKSGEDIIADVEELVIENKVVGYRFGYPYKALLYGQENTNEKTPFKIRIIPWSPFSKDQKIPVVSDWVITITEPIPELENMYKETVERNIKKKNGKTETSSTGESDTSDSD